MKNIRALHLYLGCFFAPVLIFFTITGAWQTFNLHHGEKDGTYQPPALVRSLSAVHQDQRFPHKSNEEPSPSTPFRYFVLVMSVGLLLSTLLGLVMALQMVQRRALVWISLLLGIVMPVLLLCWGGGY